MNLEQWALLILAILVILLILDRIRIKIPRLGKGERLVKVKEGQSAVFVKLENGRTVIMDESGTELDVNELIS